MPNRFATNALTAFGQPRPAKGGWSGRSWPGMLPCLTASCAPAARQPRRRPYGFCNDLAAQRITVPVSEQALGPLRPSQPLYHQSRYRLGPYHNVAYDQTSLRPSLANGESPPPALGPLRASGWMVSFGPQLETIETLP